MVGGQRKQRISILVSKWVSTHFCEFCLHAISKGIATRLAQNPSLAKG
jgi:hypothetical protein